MGGKQALGKIFGVCVLCLCLIGILPTLAHTEQILYGVTFNNQLITINTTTGAGTLVGNLNSPMFAFGLGTRGNKLYAYDQVNDRIQELNPLTAQTINSINIGAGHLIGEGGLTFRSDGIGFLSQSSGSVGQLFSFDITVPNSTPITVINGLVPSMDGLDFNSSGVLYGIQQWQTVLQNGTGLYTINTSTGATTLVGNTGLTDFDLAG